MASDGNADGNRCGLPQQAMHNEQCSQTATNTSGLAA
jgi:hypothetical protein